MLGRKLFIVEETNLKNISLSSLFLHYIYNHETVMGKYVTHNVCDLFWSVGFENATMNCQVQ